MNSYDTSKIKSIKYIKKNQCRYDLTVDNFSRYFANNILVHNTDGQNIMISWKNGKIIAARNKSHLKNAGENALDYKGIADMFAGRGDIEIAYTTAMEDLTSSIGALPDKEKEKLFDNGKKFASVEIITPITQNTVPYGQNLLVFHGVVSYDMDGNPQGEDKAAGREIGKLLKDANLESQKTFFVRGPEDIAIKPFPNAALRESYYKKKLQEVMEYSNCSENSSVLDYAIGMGKYIIKKQAEKDKIQIPEIALDGLARRIADIDKSYSIPQIKKDLGNDAEWYINLEKKDAKKLKREVFAPLENIFLEIGTELMRNISSALVANPTAASESMRKEIDNAIKTIRTTGSEEDVAKLEHELSRITAVGGIESIIPSEGITFLYKGTLYKYTGVFAALNQIRGMVAYKK
jgi:hypothetical protein